MNYRLYWWLEKNHKINHHQAGFRRKCRTEDQLFRFIQSASDGFQEKLHTAAIFIDLQQAYDRVWRQGLLLKMLNMGIHGPLYFWVKNFLSERKIRTSIGRTFSSYMEDGLPQGSALSCTLFLIFVDDLPGILPVSKSMFADDLVIWVHGTDLDFLSKHLNMALANLSVYCKLWKMKINPQKTVYSIFSLSPKTSHRRLKLKLENHPIEKEEKPVYLGVQLDTRLTLSNHIENLAEKCSHRMKVLKHLASTKWGATRNILRNLYVGYVRAAMEPTLALQASSNCEKLDKIQNNALRFICGGMKSTPTAACEIEANIEPLHLRRQKASILMKERYLRKPENHPCRELVKNWTPRQRIKKKSPLWTASDSAMHYQLPSNREATDDTPTSPLQDLIPPIINTSLLNSLINKASNPTVLRASALETIDSYQSSIHAYTDGSSTSASNSGAGVFIKIPGSVNNSISLPCGSNCNNYQAEVLAISASLEHLQERMRTDLSTSDIVLFSDSQSALEALRDPLSCTKDLLSILQIADSMQREFNISITMQWVPGHSDIYGNEMADSLAKEAASMPQESRLCDMKSVKNLVNTKAKTIWLDKWTKGKTGRNLQKHLPAPNKRDPIHLIPRKDQSTIFQYRTGHCPVNIHLARILKDHSPYCRHCKTEEETVEHHLLHCPALENQRKSLLPPEPTIHNCLYTTHQQLIKTCKFINYTHAI